ncbi:NAD(P)-dependent oxidoreductase [Gryllotalpicola ginsengisoli]|uniref:NAD(P)-dependent oxidoreductase n=1 Tax=Gryllotalpicola ginsengisoli TaxID=444608 RepID=UPI0003B64C39|nr:NAD(P)-dependent oxidoreductase [Gryllotalpicola ginsengisoli]
MPLVVSLPDDRLAAPLAAAGPLPEGAVELTTWAVDGPAPRRDIDLAVMPYRALGDRIHWAETVDARLLQGQSIGFDDVIGKLPAGRVFANAATVHETSTAELAMTLLLAAQRGIPDFVRAAGQAAWRPGWYPPLADQTVLLLGYGGVNRAVEQRLAGFEVERIIRVAQRARDTEAGRVHAVSELPELLPQADVVVVATVLSETTRGLVGAAELAALPDGALVVNVSRGPVVDTAAMLAEAGRLRFALDVTDPEPLPAEHPLWRAPGVLISPHVGGATAAMTPRMARLLHRQIRHLLAGEEPENIVLRG